MISLLLSFPLPILFPLLLFSRILGFITLRPGRPVKAVRIVSTCDDNGTPYVTIQPPQVKPAL